MVTVRECGNSGIKWLDLCLAHTDALDFVQFGVYLIIPLVVAFCFRLARMA